MLAHCRIAPSLEVAIGELPSSYVALGVGENPQAPAALGSSIMGMYRLLPQILKARRLWVSPYAMRGVNFSSQELTPPTHLAAWVRALLCTSVMGGSPQWPLCPFVNVFSWDYIFPHLSSHNANTVHWGVVDCFLNG